MKKIILLAVIVSTFFSCAKKYDITVKGQVINMYSEKPISYAGVYFQDGVGASSSFDLMGAGPTIKDSVFTDKDGY